MEEGDMVVLNDPFKGGTHLPDITLVAPVFAPAGQGLAGKNHAGCVAGGPAFYVANRAHHADVGGMAAGSMPLSTSLFQEGVIIPPLKLVKKGEVDRNLLDFFLNNVRTPVEREGDFAAQIMANVTGVRRAQELIAKYSIETCCFYSSALMDYSEAMTRAAIAAMPDGDYAFEDLMDGDGVGAADVPIRVNLSVRGETARLDFSDSGPQVRGSVNAVRAIVLSAVLYTFRALIEANVPANAGCLRPIEVLTKKGTIVDAEFPAAVAGGNVETSQRLVDVILGAMAQALPGRIPAAGQGTMNNITVGGFDPYKQRPFAYYETLAGGMGGSAHHRGESAVHSHMTNTLNTPVEALEYAYPFLVDLAGRHPGGDGMIREIELLADAEVTVLSERRTRGPYGLEGGGAGGPGRNVVVGTDGIEREMPGKFNATLPKGDRVRIETPGGGGYGKA
jgi:N-methylhydantoinase B